MDIIFGGARQGKIAYVKKKYNISDDDIFICQKNSDEVDFSKKVIANLENIVEYYIKEKKEPLSFYKENRGELSEKILIFNDYSCGNISKSYKDEKYKEATLLMLTFFVKQADSVTRVFCGIPQTLV